MINNQAARFNFGFASNMALLLWCVCGGFLLHMLESNYLTILLKPTYEDYVDTVEDIVSRGLAVIYFPGREATVEDMKNSPSELTRNLTDLIIVAKVIF